MKIRWPDDAGHNILRTPRAIISMEKMELMSTLQDALSRLGDDDSKPHEIDEQVWRVARVAALEGLRSAIWESGGPWENGRKP